MQQTGLDNWLRRKLLYVNNVYCNTPPASVPGGCAMVENPPETGERYRYRFSTRSPEVLDELLDALRLENITFTTRIKEREVWYAGLLNNPNRSFTSNLIWIAIIAALALFIVSGLPQRLWHLLAEDSPPGAVRQ